MLYNRSHLSVRHACSTDETRYNLCGVHFLADGTTEATNGDWLLRAKPHKQDMEEFPATATAGIPAHPPELEPFILPRDTVDALVKRLPKKQMALPILSNALLDVARANGNGDACFITTDLETQEMTKGRKIDGEFPNTDKVIPAADKKPTATFGVNLKYLAACYKAVVEFGGKQHTNVKIEIFGELEPIRLTYSNPDTGELLAVIMPVRL